MIDDLQLLQGITEEDLKSLQENNPKGFADLANRVKQYRLQLARTNINHFVQYVMFDEVNRKPLRQAPYHIEMQDHIDQHRHAVIIGHTELGKCVSAQTVLIDQYGCPATVLELKDRLDRGEVVKVITVDPVKKIQRYVPVKRIFFDSEAHSVKVTTHNGRETTVSYNHPFKAIIGKSSKRTAWIAAGDLRRGDVVITTDVLAPPEARRDSGMTPEDAFVLGFILRFSHGHIMSIKAEGVPIGRTRVQPDAGLDYNVHRVARKICERYGWEFVPPVAGKAHARAEIVGADEWLRGHGLVRAGQTRAGPIGRHFFSFAAGPVGPVPAAVVGDERLAEAFATGYLVQEPLVSQSGYSRFGVPAYMAQSLLRVFARCGVICRYARDPRKREGVNFTSRLRLGGASLFRLYRYAYAISSGAYEQVWTDALAAQGVAPAGQAQVAPPTYEEPRAWVPTKVIKVERAGKIPVYGIEIDDLCHTHLTDGFLTHNTQQVSVARPLFELGRNPNLRIAIIQSTGVLARDILRTIAGHIENNPRLHEVFPNLRPGDLWTQTALTVEREYGVKDPSIQVRGAFSKILGVRIDRLYLDDVLTLDYTRTKHMRDRMMEWFISELMSRLTAHSRVAALGNAWHLKDLYHELMKNPAWHGMIIPVRDPITKKSRWPEVWSQERIAEFEAVRTPAETARALDCIAFSEETSRFRNDWFNRAIIRGTGLFGEHLTLLPSLESIPWDDRGMPKLRGTTYSGVDLAFSDKVRSDWNVIFTIMVAEDGHIYLLNIERGRWSTAETVDRIIDTHMRYGSVIFVESVAAQRAVVDWCNQKNAEVPVYPFNTRGQGETYNKWHGVFGVEMVAAGLANNQWTVPRAGTPDDPGEIDPLIRIWIDECMTFSAESHAGDELMASWIAVRGASLFGGDHYMTAIDPTRDGDGEPWVGSTRSLNNDEVRNRIGEALYASIDLDAPDGYEEGTREFDV